MLLLLLLILFCHGPVLFYAVILPTLWVFHNCLSLWPRLLSWSISITRVVMQLIAVTNSRTVLALEARLGSCKEKFPQSTVIYTKDFSVKNSTPQISHSNELQLLKKKVVFKSQTTVWLIQRDVPWLVFENVLSFFFSVWTPDARTARK